MFIRRRRGVKAKTRHEVGGVREEVRVPNLVVDFSTGGGRKIRYAKNE